MKNGARSECRQGDEVSCEPPSGVGARGLELRARSLLRAWMQDFGEEQGSGSAEQRDAVDDTVGRAWRRQGVGLLHY